MISLCSHSSCLSLWQRHFTPDDYISFGTTEHDIIVFYILGCSRVSISIENLNSMRFRGARRSKRRVFCAIMLLSREWVCVFFYWVFSVCMYGNAFFVHVYSTAFSSRFSTRQVLISTTNTSASLCVCARVCFLFLLEECMHCFMRFTLSVVRER